MEKTEKYYSVTKQRADLLMKAFTYHAPIANQIPRYKELRDAAKDLAMLISQITPATREQSLAITKLEECVMWANKAIALEGEE